MNKCLPYAVLFGEPAKRQALSIYADFPHTCIAQFPGIWSANPDMCLHSFCDMRRALLLAAINDCGGGGYDGQSKDVGTIGENRAKERLWFSPHCVRQELPLFMEVA